jgi:succinyl-diaminopimelate desuccinylase
MPTTTTPTTSLIKQLSRLISLPTVTSDRAANLAAQDYVAEQLHGLPLTIKRYTNKGYPSLVATTQAVKGGKHPRLWLAGHLDVVPGAAKDFRPLVKGGRLIGRGAYDMKFAIAGFLQLLQDLGPELEHYSLGLMLTSDEEVSGRDGVEWLVNQQGYRGEAVLLPECGTSWTIATGSKGIMTWQLRSRGQASHASRPWNGTNAIDQLVAFVNIIKAHLPAEPCGDEDHAHGTVNLGIIHGGEVPNQVPDYAEAQVDIRLMPETTTAQVSTWFETAAETVPGVGAEIISSSEADVAPITAPGELFCSIAKAVTGHSPAPMLTHGSSDARYFAPHNIPVISVPPTGGGQHSDYEWIDLASLKQYYEIMRRFTEQWAGPGR